MNPVLNKLSTFKASPYTNSTIHTSDNQYAYVTNTGVVKPYGDTPLSSNCNAPIVEVSGNLSSLNYPFGTSMIPSQSCGNELKYIMSMPTVNTQLNDYISVGQVGYVDYNSILHSITPDSIQYTTNYNTVNDLYITGNNMQDCSTQPTPVQYNDYVYITQDNLVGFMNNSSICEFSKTATTGFYLRPLSFTDPPSPIKYGDQVVIAASNISISSPCGIWGCKVASMNTVNHLMEFTSGIHSFYFQPPIGSTFNIGDPIMYNNAVTIAFTPDTTDTSNCGWYGCYVAKLNRSNKIEFTMGKQGKDNQSSFTIRSSLKPVDASNACNMNDLTSACNDDPNCNGFIYSPVNNTWQPLTTAAINGSTFIESNQPTSLYMKQPFVDISDSSCTNDTIQPVDTALFNHYPYGTQLVHDGTGQCMIDSEFIDQYMNDVDSIMSRQKQNYDRMLHRYDSIYSNNQSMEQTIHSNSMDIEDKLNQYYRLDQELKKKQKNGLYQAQEEDNTIKSNQQFANGKVWEAISIIGIICVVVILLK
jgi:hypothetical protein